VFRLNPGKQIAIILLVGLESHAKLSLSSGDGITLQHATTGFNRMQGRRECCFHFWKLELPLHIPSAKRCRTCISWTPHQQQIWRPTRFPVFALKYGTFWFFLSQMLYILKRGILHEGSVKVKSGNGPFGPLTLARLYWGWGWSQVSG